MKKGKFRSGGIMGGSVSGQMLRVTAHGMMTLPPSARADAKGKPMTDAMRAQRDQERTARKASAQAQAALKRQRRGHRRGG